MKNGYFVFQKYDKFLSGSLGFFMKHRLLISKDCAYSTIQNTDEKIFRFQKSR